MSCTIPAGRTPALVALLLSMASSARSDTPVQPPGSIARLELLRGDINETGSCYSLDSVLRAAQLNPRTEDARVAWTRHSADEWTMRAMVKGQWREYTFRREGDRLLPVHSDLPDHDPGVNLERAVDELLASTHDGSVPRVPRCGGD
jgi:hypothetical protein